MRESLSTYIKSPRNAAIFEAIDTLNRTDAAPVNLFIYGPRHSGKSTLIRSISNDAKAGAAEQGVGSNMPLFSCSGADIAIALTFDADDGFFENLGSVPVVLVDDIEPLLSHVNGDHLLDLMIKQRASVGGSTIIVSDVPFEELSASMSAESLGQFTRLEMVGLDDAERIGFARSVEAYFGNDSSPSVGDDAVAYVVERAGDDLHEAENAMHYFAVDEDCAALGHIDKAIAMRLLGDVKG